MLTLEMSTSDCRRSAPRGFACYPDLQQKQLAQRLRVALPLSGPEIRAYKLPQEVRIILLSAHETAGTLRSHGAGQIRRNQHHPNNGAGAKNDVNAQGEATIKRGAAAFAAAPPQAPST